MGRLCYRRLRPWSMIPRKMRLQYVLYRIRAALSIRLHPLCKNHSASVKRAAFMPRAKPRLPRAGAAAARTSAGSSPCRPRMPLRRCRPYSIFFEGFVQRLLPIRWKNSLNLWQKRLNFAFSPLAAHFSAKKYAPLRRNFRRKGALFMTAHAAPYAAAPAKAYRSSKRPSPPTGGEGRFPLRRDRTVNCRDRRKSRSAPGAVRGSPFR